MVVGSLALVCLLSNRWALVDIVLTLPGIKVLNPRKPAAHKRLIEVRLAIIAECERAMCWQIHLRPLTRNQSFRCIFGPRLSQVIDTSVHGMLNWVVVRVLFHRTQEVGHGMV